MSEEVRPTPFTTKPRPDGEALPLSVRNDRAASAYRLRMTGMNWATVAETVGWGDVPNPEKFAQLQVKDYLISSAVQVSDEERQHILQLEMDRLDRLQEIAWELVEERDLKAIDVVLRVMNQRARLLGLETINVNSQVTQAMVVVGGDKENFLRTANKVIKGESIRRDEAS